MTDAEMQATLDSVRIVLIRPSSAENIGSVCRAMKTMGLTDLRIVDAEGAFDLDRAAVVAVHAEDVLEKAGYVDRIEDAVDECALVAGTSRRWGKRRHSARLTPVELAGRIVSGGGVPAALVFGNESSGLTDDELANCSAFVTIESSHLERSLNLSHAVQIICYEIYRALHEATGKRFYRPIDGRRLESMVVRITGRLTEIGAADDTTKALLMGLLARAALSSTEAKRLEGLFDKLAGIAHAEGRTRR